MSYRRESKKLPSNRATPRFEFTGIKSVADGWLTDRHTVSGSVKRCRLLPYRTKLPNARVEWVAHTT